MREFEQGKTPKQLIQEKKASKNTIYRYWKRYKLYKELQQKLWELVRESV